MRILIVSFVLAAFMALGCQEKAQQPSPGFSTQAVGSSVSFELTPSHLDDARLSFELRATTHSGDLSEVDLKKAMTLVVGGEAIVPSKVPTLSGHHDGGEITFELKSRPEHFGVRIRGVRDMGELSLDW
jgi:hypothetical protein